MKSDTKEFLSILSIIIGALLLVVGIISIMDYIFNRPQIESELSKSYYDGNTYYYTNVRIEGEIVWTNFTPATCEGIKRNKFMADSALTSYKTILKECNK